MATDIARDESEKTISDWLTRCRYESLVIFILGTIYLKNIEVRRLLPETKTVSVCQEIVYAVRYNIRLHSAVSK